MPDRTHYADAHTQDKPRLELTEKIEADFYTQDVAGAKPQEPPENKTPVATKITGMVFDTEDVVNHDGLFGISREDWEAIKADIPLRDVEQRFLDCPTDSMAIYQLRYDAPVELRFARMESLTAPPDPANYEAIYTREIYPDSDRSRILENFYYIFNEERPVDFTGHSLSVSDIVALKLDGKVSYHYCDSIGFTGRWRRTRKASKLTGN